MTPQAELVDPRPQVTPVVEAEAEGKVNAEEAWGCEYGIA